MIRELVTFPNFHKYYSQVVELNYAFGNTTLDNERLEIQTPIVLSEVKETIKAADERDLKELVDGVVDIFVTYSFYNHIYNRGFEMNIIEYIPTKFWNYAKEEYIFQRIHDDATLVYQSVENGLIPSTLYLERLIGHLIMAFVYLKNESVEDATSRVESFFEAVQASNESKLVPESVYNEMGEQAILDAAEERYRGMHENIVLLPTEYAGVKCYMLKADGGKGKFLKPITFKEPVFML